MLVMVINSFEEDVEKMILQCTFYILHGVVTGFIWNRWRIHTLYAYV